jgi:DNA processing protein
MEKKSCENPVWYLYWFAIFPGLGRKGKRRLLECYTPKELFSMDRQDWKPFLTEKEWQSLMRAQKGNRFLFHIEEIGISYEKLNKKGIRFVPWESEEYPKRLKQIDDAPFGIFVKGSLPDEKPAIAIVGSRIPTAYGKEMARYFARELAGAGIRIISGMAAGIDVAAHKGAMEGGGKTYAVLGNGPDIIYPKENYSAYETILQEGGILSEYPPGEKPLAYRFPERNRIISGLSDGVLVVEAKEKSGSLITADCGLEQGKEIYALPGRAGDLLSGGCNWLIRQGAKLVTEPGQILEDFVTGCEKSFKNNNNLDKLLDNKEKIVYDCLGLEPKHIEDIIRETNLSVSESISILFRLELNGYIKQIVKDYYIIRL